MKTRPWDLRVLVLLAGLCLAPQVGTAHGPDLTFHAFTRIELVNAILAANSVNARAVIFVFPREYLLTDTFDSEFGLSALPPISAHITLVGRDVAKTILRSSDTATRRRIFTVLPGAGLLVRQMTITGGSTDEFLPFPGNGGGAAGNFRGSLRFQDCVITRNSTATERGGEPGGGILSFNGRLELLRTTVSDNLTTGSGGGIALLSGSGVIRDSIISGNQNVGLGTTSGVGIIVSGTLGIYGSTIAGNVGFSEGDDAVVQGGGIFISATGTVVMANSAVVGNDTHAPSQGAGSGGGIYNAGTLTIKNGTVAENRAGTSGGGIFNSGFLRLQGVTVSNNEAKGQVLPRPFFDHVYPPGCDFDNAPQFCITGGGGVWNEPSGRSSIAGSVIANNHIEVLAQMLGPDCGGTFTSQGHNAVGTGADCALKPAVKGTDTHDLINVDPRLSALEDNGEPGNAHYPLLADSPLIDAGDKVGLRCTFRDQIGQRRLDGDHDGSVDCDIGAIEFRP